MGDWWQDTLDNHGDMSKAFNDEFTPLFEGSAEGGKITAEVFIANWAKVQEFRAKILNHHNAILLSVEEVEGFWQENDVAAPCDVLTAMRFAWCLCFDI